MLRYIDPHQSSLGQQIQLLRDQYEGSSVVTDQYEPCPPTTFTQGTGRPRALASDVPIVTNPALDAICDKNRVIVVSKTLRSAAQIAYAS